eukprot:m.13547 g.13547  ORF g.13547 m.13547 type:complete len:131 (+) comp10156_c0_seq1:603-995(+)
MASTLTMKRKSFVSLAPMSNGTGKSSSADTRTTCTFRQNTAAKTKRVSVLEWDAPNTTIISGSFKHPGINVCDQQSRGQSDVNPTSHSLSKWKFVAKKVCTPSVCMYRSDTKTLGPLAHNSLLVVTTTPL